MAEIIYRFRALIYAVLILLPGVVGFSANYYLLFVTAVFILERKKIIELVKDFVSAPFSKKNRLVWSVFLLMSISLGNKMFNGNDVLCLKDYYASFYLFPFLIISARLAFSEKFFKYLIVLTVLESIVAIAEYSLGVRSFFMDTGDLNLITDYKLLYNSRVFGISVNSSVLAYKILIVFFLIDHVKLKKWTRWLLCTFLLIGLLITFSRMVVLVLLFYWFVAFLVKTMRLRKKLFQDGPALFYLVILTVVLVFNSFLTNQLFRGSHQAESVTVLRDVAQSKSIETCISSHAMELRAAEVDIHKQALGDRLMLQIEGVQSSGRKLIWLNYINFIDKKFLFGNGSDKLMLKSWDKEKGKYNIFHAHNSYMMLLSTNGVLIAFLYLVVYLFLFKTKNYLVLFSILLYSIGNYGVFWGFSYLDVIFIVFLTTNFKLDHDNERASGNY